MNKLIFIDQPNLAKGRKIVSLILADNRGEIYYTDWKHTCDDKELKKRISELRKLEKKIDKKMGIKSQTATKK